MTLSHSAAVDRTSPVPAYHQMARSLKTRIDRGDWLPGQKLPTEIDLSREYEVSRATVRQALTELAREAVISREQGKGTFVLRSPSPLLHDLSLPMSLADRSRTQGFRLEARIFRLEQLTGEPDHSVTDQLRLKPGERIVVLERVIMIDDVPSASSTSWLPGDEVPDIVSQGLIDGSVSATLRDRYNLPSVRYDNLLEVQSADLHQSQLLSIPVAAPLIRLMATTYTTDDHPIEVSWTHWRSDRVRFRFAVHGG